MNTEIKYKFAEDEDGNIVFIDNAVSGKKYYCSGCKEEMIFRNGKIRQKHYSHKTTENCTGGGGEGYLHETFKKIVLQKIKDCIIKKEAIDVLWTCTVCKQQHNGNLLHGINDIKTEFNLEGCRPDLVLFGVKGNVPLIIEIVDKHEPEVNVLEFCKKYSIFLMRIKLDDLSDLEKIDEKINKPTDLIAFNPQQCPVYINAMQQRKIVHAPISPNRISGIRGSLMDYIDSQSSYPYRKSGSYGWSYGKPYRSKGSRKRN